jgi:solute carrier family 45, member 1/2/4
VQHYLRDHLPPPTRHDEDLLWDTATRIASFALVLESFVSLFANLFLPLLLRGPLHVPGLTLRRYWIASHILFAALMWSTLFITRVQGAVTMVAVAGVSWALALWAPFALIAKCVSHLNDVSRRESIASSRTSTPDIRPEGNYGTLDGQGISVTRDRGEDTPVLAPLPIRPVLNGALPQEKPDEITSAGAIMGLHNVFISSPQFISTVLASIIFKVLGAGGRGDDIHPENFELVGAGGSIGWVLRIGGLGGLVAAYLTWCLDEEADGT